MKPPAGNTRTTLDRAVALHKAGRLSEARKLYEGVLRAEQTNSDALNLLAMLHLQQNHPDKAIKLARDALRVKPDWAAPAETLGRALLAMGDAEGAAESLGPLAERADVRPEVLDLLGSAHIAAGRSAEAEATLLRALDLRPGESRTLNNLGTLYQRVGRIDDASVSLRAAVEADPGYALAWSNLARTLNDLGRPIEAESAARRATALDPNLPEAHANLSLALLVQGRLGEGFAEYEWRSRVGGFAAGRRNLSLPHWDGGDIAGRTILITAEQGYGSNIQFARYAPLLVRQGAKVRLEASPPLYRIFSTLSPEIEIVLEGRSPPAADLWAPIMSLPHLLGTDLESIPADIPYLHADPGDLSVWRGRLDQTANRRVGLCWAGNPAHANDRNRSMGPEHLGPLATVPGWSLVSLQKGSDPTAIEGILDPMAEIRDFADTAALISALDLVITVDTAIAHLAGALGRPVWLLLPHVPEWRWMLDRADSPWYPTLRIFRQSNPGDWPGVVAAVARALTEY